MSSKDEEVPHPGNPGPEISRGLPPDRVIPRTAHREETMRNRTEARRSRPALDALERRDVPSSVTLGASPLHSLEAPTPLPAVEGRNVVVHHHSTDQHHHHGQDSHGLDAAKKKTKKGTPVTPVLTGPQGPQGAQGPQGIPGPAGAEGPKGA